MLPKQRDLTFGASEPMVIWGPLDLRAYRVICRLANMNTIMKTWKNIERKGCDIKTEMFPLVLTPNIINSRYNDDNCHQLDNCVFLGQIIYWYFKSKIYFFWLPVYRSGKYLTGIILTDFEGILGGDNFLMHNS